jgi:hypothetical protein
LIDVSKLLIGRLTSGTKKRWWCYYDRNVFTTEGEGFSKKGCRVADGIFCHVQEMENTGKADSRLAILGTIRGGGGMVTDFVIQPILKNTFTRIGIEPWDNTLIPPKRVTETISMQ